MEGKKRYKRIIRRLSMFLFLGALILPQALWIVLKTAYGDNQEVIVRLDFELGENRELASLPDGSDFGNITEQLDTYYNDHAPFRSIFISINRRINSRLERVYSSRVQPVFVALIYKRQQNAGGSGAKGWKEDTEAVSAGHGWAYAEETGGVKEPDGNSGKEDSGAREPGGENGLGSPSEKQPDEKDKNMDYASGNDNGLNHEAGDKPETGKDYGSENEASSEASGVGSAYLPPREMNGTVFGRDDWMFCSYDNSIGYYCGSNIMSEQQMKDKLELMRRLQQICDKRGIQLQFLIAPNKEQVYSEYMPSYNIENTYKREPRFVDYVKQNSSVKIIYPIDELCAAKNSMSTYFKYDTHWNHYGGFVATQALYKDMGIETTDIESVSYSDASSIWGLVITAGLSWQDYERDYDHIPDYRPEVLLFNTDGVIDIVHTENSAVYRTQSTASYDSNFVMIGDSFRLYMMPYLERDFSHVSIAHRNNIQDVSEDIKKADILVIECVERLDDSLNGTLLELIGILGNVE